MLLNSVANKHCPRHFPGDSDGKNLSATWETFDLWVGKVSSPRREWQPMQYSCLENPMDRGDWLATDHGVTESQT